MENPSRSDVREPLTIPRESLLATLQENLDTAKAEREEKHAKENAALDEFKAFLTDHLDEVSGYLVRCIGWNGWEETLKTFQRTFEDGDYAPAGVKPSKKETALEKYVRVLGLASNSTISVEPGDDLYPLL